MLFEEGAEKECQVLDEVLLVVLSVLEGLSDVSRQWQHLVQCTCMMYMYMKVYYYTCICMYI